MHKRVLFCLLILYLMSGIQCGLFEPENGKGSVRIHLVSDTGTIQAAKTQESLSSVRCVLKKGSDTIHDQNHAKVNGSFQIDIEDLDPGDDYSILLYGKNINEDIIGRGYRDNISVIAGDVANVSISWSWFNPTLVSPANGSTTSDNTPTFDWSSVSGASIYALEGDNSNSFSSLELDQSNLASSDYMPSTSLADGTYYWRVRSKDSQGNWGGWSAVWSFTINPETGTVTDIDGNVYQTIQIGNQRWMMENLKVTRYRNGDAIPNVTGSTDWSNLTTGARCAYDNDENNVATYGRLYNWYTADDSREIAPAGWHLPTDDEWKELEMYLGMSQSEADNTGYRGTDEGGKMKESGTAHWLSPNTGATNESGFSALPGGSRDNDGHFHAMGPAAYFWSSTENGSNDAWSRALVYCYSEVYRSYTNKQIGFSVRCIRDH